MGLRIRALERSDVRDGFESGSLAQDRFIREFAWQNQERHHLGVTYVAVDDATRGVLGFVTLVAGEITPDLRAASGAPRAFGGRIPALRIGCLAVDRRVQGRGLGRELLAHAVAVALHQSATVGCAALAVDAHPDAVAFYRRVGFRAVGLLEGASGARPRPVPMVMPLGLARQALL